MIRFMAYLLLGVLTEYVCFHFAGINPEGGGDLMGLFYMFSHFPLYLVATKYQLTASQWSYAAFATYPFFWAAIWFCIFRLITRITRKKKNDANT